MGLTDVIIVSYVIRDENEITLIKHSKSFAKTIFKFEYFLRNIWTIPYNNSIYKRVKKNFCSLIYVYNYYYYERLLYYAF